MKEENQNSYTIQSDEAIGQVQIADEVVAIIAGLAATEVEGVASMAGNITNELVVEVAINIDYGYSVPKTSRMVQEKVKASIENMTGLIVSDVNVTIASVCMEKHD